MLDIKRSILPFSVPCNNLHMSPMHFGCQNDNRLNIFVIFSMNSHLSHSISYFIFGDLFCKRRKSRINWYISRYSILLKTNWHFEIGGCPAAQKRSSSRRILLQNSFCNDLFKLLNCESFSFVQWMQRHFFGFDRLQPVAYDRKWQIKILSGSSTSIWFHWF